MRTMALALAWLALLASTLALAQTLVEAQAVSNEREVTLTNERLSVTLDRQRTGEVTSLVDRQSGRELAAKQSERWLFFLTLSSRGDTSGQPLYLSGSDAASIDATTALRDDRAVATLAFHHLGGRGVEVVCTVSVGADDPLVRWRLTARLPEDLVLESVQFPRMVLRAPLGETADDDAAVLGQTKGGLYPRPAEWKPKTALHARQPGSLAAQFACYYDADLGFYTATQDTRGYPKTCQVRRTDEGLEMVWHQHCFASGDFDLGYDVVHTTFRAADPSLPTDWRDAADIYKHWAVKQPWCARTYADRPDIPEWLKSGPALVRFGRSWLGDPSTVDGWLDSYWDKYFPSHPPLITTYWGWEKVGPWVTPDYFPVVPSDEEFSALVARTRKLGCHAFPWPSGYHWTLTYDKREDGTFVWDDRERFDRIALPHAAHNRDGTPYRGARSWLRGGETGAVCPGDPWTIAWFNDIGVELCRRGADMIQVDQVVGASFYWCYSPDHPHPAGPGPWMADVFHEQLRTLLQACREVEPEAVVCFEEPNEMFIQEAAVQDYRDCEIINRSSPPVTLASVFNYVYHEYLPTFQSNPRANDRFLEAYCLVNGQIPHLAPSPVFGSGPLLLNGDFERWTDSVPSAWDKVSGWQGKDFDGRCGRDGEERHGGAASLYLENDGQDQIVQVSQNVDICDAFRIGGTYRLSAWMKTARLAKPNRIALATLKAGLQSTGGWGIELPAEGTQGWTRGEVTFTIPEGSEYLRLMLHVEGPAKVWLDDLALEEVLDDGSARPVLRPETPRDHALMARWVELFHGAGRPYLLLGRMLHPPKLETGVTTYAGREFPAILHNAYRAPDGSEAVIAVNVTDEPQDGRLTWHDRTRDLRLKPWEVRLLTVGD